MITYEEVGTIGLTHPYECATLSLPGSGLSTNTFSENPAYTNNNSNYIKICNYDLEIKKENKGVQNLVISLLHRSSSYNKLFLIFKSFVQSQGGRIWLLRMSEKRVSFTAPPGSNSLVRDGFPGPDALFWRKNASN